MILSYIFKWLFCLVSFCLDKETARATARFGKLHIQQEKGAAPNGSRMVVFSTARNLTTLAVAEHLNWIGDGTFYVAPRITSQSYSFPAVINGKAYSHHESHTDTGHFCILYI